MVGKEGNGENIDYDCSAPINNSSIINVIVNTDVPMVVDETTIDFSGVVNFIINIP